MSIRALYTILVACVTTLASVSATTRIISDPTTADDDFINALSDQGVDEIIQQVDVTMTNGPELGVEVRRYLNIRGDQCVGENGRCTISIGATSTFPRRGFFVTETSHLTMSNVVISGGIPPNDPTYGSSGGAIFVEKLSCLTCVNCKISNNDAGRGSGGAVYLSTEASFFCRDCTIDNNKAKRGGAVFLSGSKYVSAKFENTVFLSNAAVPLGIGEGQGGVLYSGGNCVVEFTDVTFDRNRADGSGGVAQFLGGVGYFNNVIWKMNSASERLNGPLIFVEDTAEIYYKDYIADTSEVELCCVPGTFFPLVVKKQLGGFNFVTTEFTAPLTVVENVYCPADALIPPPPPPQPSPPPFGPPTAAGRLPRTTPPPGMNFTLSGGSSDAFPEEAKIVLGIGGSVLALLLLVTVVTYIRQQRNKENTVGLYTRYNNERFKNSFRMGGSPRPTKVQPFSSPSSPQQKPRHEIADRFSAIDDENMIV